jgi:DNA end-binding protein Ku
MRAIWSGAIGFGLVNIPVKLYSAIENSSLDLDMLDKKDHSNIRFQRVNENTGKVVKWEDIVKGFKYEDDYVVLEDEDFEKANPEKSHTIEINEFVKEESISSMYYENVYYIEPTKGGERAYALIREALKESGKVALGTFVMRTKENFCMLKADGDMVLLMKLRFPEEIRDTKDMDLPAKTQVKPAELKMALALINQLTPKRFDIRKYKDTYTDELMKIIELKAKGKRITRPKFKIVRNKTKDIMAQLKDSIEKSKKAS